MFMYFQVLSSSNSTSSIDLSETGIDVLYPILAGFILFTSFGFLFFHFYNRSKAQKKEKEEKVKQEMTMQRGNNDFVLIP